jgi:excisionase family DNA binding protein
MSLTVVRLPDDLLTTDELAEHLRLPPRTIEKWRADRHGPVYGRYGRHVRYRWADVQEWIRSQHVPVAS